MKNTLGLAAVAFLAMPIFLNGCDRPPTSPDRVNLMPAYDLGADADPGGGAIVSNSGEGQPDVFCFVFFGGVFVTTHGTAVRTPSGNAKLDCQFAGLPPIPETQILKNWRCNINQGGLSQTHESQWVRTPSGSAQLTCEFSGKPLNDAAVSFGSSVAAAQQGSFTAPLIDVPGQRVTGTVVAIGRACNSDPLTGDPSGKIALIERGVCAFAEKIANAMNAGAVAGIVYNSAAGGEQIITMGGFVNVPIPGVFVARSTGLALQAAAPADVTITYCTRSASCRGEL